jgi:PAS domain S-box-containing protein
MTTAKDFAAYFGESQTTRLAVYDMLMGAVPVGVWYTNEAGSVIYVNAGWTRVTGTAAEAVMDRGYRTCVHPDDLPYVERAMHQALQDHTTFEITFRMRFVDGYKWLYSKAVWSDKHNGFPSGLIGITLDVTREHNMTAEGQMLWHCVEQVSNPIIVTDPTLKDNPIIYVNTAFTQLTDYTLDEVRGRNPRFLHNGDSEQPVLQLIQDSVAKGQSIANVVVRNYTKAGKLYFADLHLSPVHVSGNLAYWIGVQVIVTEQLKAQEIEELRKVVNQLLAGSKPSIGR